MAVELTIAILRVLLLVRRPPARVLSLLLLLSRLLPLLLLLLLLLLSRLLPLLLLLLLLLLFCLRLLNRLAQHRIHVLRLQTPAAM